jgi:hypothetical protein
MINEYVNFEREALNTSTHDPILVRFSCNLEGKTQHPGVNYTKRIKWNKIDKQEYKNNVEAKITTLQEINQPIAKRNIDKVVNELHDILYSCTEQQQKPKNNNPKRRPNRKHKWTPEIHKAMKRSKNQFAKWKAANRPRDPDNPTYQDMKECRKTLRTMQRQHEAQLRYNRYEEIMELQQNNNNGFYSLIRKQRDTKSISGSIINFKNVQVSNDDEILLGWADYFKDLATPTSMPEFDQAFLQQAENDVKNLYNLYTNDRQETLKKVSIDEIATTVKSLKNGKSPDERHISAEHLKYGGRKLLAACCRKALSNSGMLVGVARSLK